MDPEIERSDSSPRVRSARSVAPESAPPVHAAMAGDPITFYSRRERQGTSEERFPGVRSGRRMAGTRRRDTGTRGLKPPLYDLWRWWPRGLKPPLCGHSHHGIAL